MLCDKDLHVHVCYVLNDILQRENKIKVASISESTIVLSTKAQ